MMTGRELMRRSVRQTRVDNRMLRQAQNYAILYIEGESDQRFYIWATEGNQVLLQSMNGKKDVIEAIRKDNEQKLKGRLAIVDCDFDFILKRIPYKEKNLIVTDTHDIETVMYEACSYRVIEDEFISIDKLGFISNEGKNLWSYVIQFAIQLGKLRLLSCENKWNLNFREAEQRMKDYFHLKNDFPEFKFYGYMKKVWSCSPSCKLSYEELKDSYNDDKRKFDQWHICRGHDISLMLSIIYSLEMYGTKRISVDDVERTLRTSYKGSKGFLKSNMCQTIREWQRLNSEWRILRAELC